LRPDARDFYSHRNHAGRLPWAFEVLEVELLVHRDGLASRVMTEPQNSRGAALRLLQDVEALLKNPQLALDFARGGVNTSIALIAVQGLAAYLDGNKSRAADDLGTAVDEIRARLGAPASHSNGDSRE
jgi:hypothetical protein